MSYTHELLVTHQVRTANIEFTKFLDTVMRSTDIFRDPVRVILFNNERPLGVYDVFDKEGIYFVQHGISQLPFYYDLKTKTYRAKIYYQDHEFIFANESIERNRQILEIIQSLYVYKYMGASQNYLTELVKKLKVLTIDSANDSQNEEVVFGSFYGSEHIVEDMDNLIDFDCSISE